MNLTSLKSSFKALSNDVLNNKSVFSYFSWVFLETVTYTMMKESGLAAFRDTPIQIIGDGRCDSLRFNAKYGTYTVMDVNSSRILTFSL